MALVKCKECGKEISDTLEVCIHCGCPLSYGKVIFQASDTFIGALGKYTITDEDGNTVAKLKSGQKIEIDLEEDKAFYVGRKTAFWQKGVEVITHVDEINKFLIDMGSAGFKVVVSKIEE